jgi:outer membrane protein TolC
MGIIICAFIISSDLHAQKILTLEQALAEANQKSPTIRQARLSLIQNQENLNAQRLALKSNLALTVNPIRYVHNREYNETLGEWRTNEQTSSSGQLAIQQPIAATDGTISLVNSLGWQDSYINEFNTFKGFNNNLQLKLDQPIFTYNRTKMTLRKLELNLENSQLNYSLKELSVEKLVTQAFYEVYLSQSSAIIAKDDYTNRQKSYEIIKNKVDAGLVSKGELYQAEVDMLTSKSTLQNDEVTLQNKLDEFKQLLGMSLDEDVMVLAEVSINPIDVNLTNALNLGLASRMELRQRSIDIEQGQFDLITTNALNEFKGNVGLSVGLIGENKDFPNVYNNPTNNQDISVSLTIPLYDWGEKKARLRAVQAAQESKMQNLNDERTSIALNIRQAYRTLNNLLIQIEIAKKNEENAALTYDINLEKYKNGDLTSMDLNLYQNQLTTKKQSHTNALIQYKLALLDLKIQTLYDFEKNVSIVPNFTQPK